MSGKELQPRRQRRTHVPDKPNYSLNLWSIMKNCIGKELSKIPMPVRVSCAHGSRVSACALHLQSCMSSPRQVNFNEPLSMLQRLTEDLEYHELLDKAARCDSSLEQMCLVAAFSISSYSTTVHRTAKPFNPLLGETYELDRREEFGYRSLCEQVTAQPQLSLQSHGHCCLLFIRIEVKTRHPISHSVCCPSLWSGEPSSPCSCTSCDFPTGLDLVAGNHNRQQVPWQIPLHYASGYDISFLREDYMCR